MVSIEQYRNDLQQDGFVIVRSLLGPREFAELKGELDRYISQVVPELPHEHAFYEDIDDPATLKQMQLMDIDPYFKQYKSHATWNALASGVLGEPVDCQGPEWFNKPPGTDHVTPPHQDNFYFCLAPPNVVTIWMAIDPVDQENGGLVYVKGSHLDGLRSHKPSQILGFSQTVESYNMEDEENEVAIILEPGDAVIHHGNTIHRANPNLSDRQRRAFAMVLRGESCQRDEDAYAGYMESMREQHRLMGLMK